MLALFRDKKCCNFINLFLCILWDLIVMDLVLSGENLIKTVEGHMGSTCQKLKSQCISRVISRLGNLSRWPTRSTDSWNFKCDSYTLHLYYIYIYILITHKIVRRLFKKKKKKTLERGFYNTYNFRQSYSSLSENFLVVSSIDAYLSTFFDTTCVNVWLYCINYIHVYH